MFKKIFGILMMACAVLSFIGMIASKITVSTLAIQLLFLLGGIFLVSFDNVYRKSYEEGFKARKRQCTFVTVFCVIFWVIMLIMGIGGIYIMAASSRMQLNPYWLWLATLVFYAAPALVFSAMFDRYVKPYSACRKRFGINDTTVHEYLGSLEKIGESNDFVIIKNSVLFFPKAFCIIPINKIQSISVSKDMLGQKAKFILVNKKKILVYTKQYKDVAATLDKTGVSA